MSANAVVPARIDKRIKEEASIILAATGLTVSDAFRIILTRVAHEKPFHLSRWCQMKLLSRLCVRPCR
ncbi:MULTISPECIES: type II toxin-antitoxin system RelB/DinJ family antitoxin [Mycetohabitans]|uniref:Addiction module RelB/DinJ family antitoxin n=2 Tax=Mycetohabitans endofungorum TaxID=417203 RepID=A0A2P5KD79_9BURK|nr:MULTISPECIES: type II toxin-antitoxin system RelB/DinJ family antitoxin [Mycetohabitans]PPB84645.1 addiction module RelB/DinJ family antitoxin [Mycetohabitans endofungorum]